MTDYGNCEQCKRPMRGAREKAADFPGTMCFAGKGLCASCKKSNSELAKNPNYKPKAPPVSDSPNCLRCHRPFRKSHTTVKQFPGTVRRASGDGFCSGCLNTLNREHQVIIDWVIEENNEAS